MVINKIHYEFTQELLENNNLDNFELYLKKSLLHRLIDEVQDVNVLNGVSYKWETISWNELITKDTPEWKKELISTLFMRRSHRMILEIHKNV